MSSNGYVKLKHKKNRRKKKQLYRARKNVHYFKMADSDPGNDSCIRAKKKSKPRGDLHQEEKKQKEMHK